MVEDKIEKKVLEWSRKPGFSNETPDELRARLTEHFRQIEARKELRKKANSDRYYGVDR